MPDPEEAPGGRPRSSSAGWDAYVVPMVAFLALTWFEGRFPRHYPLLYAAKIAIVAALMVRYRSAWRDIRFDRSVLLPGALVGLAVIAAWIAISESVPWATVGGGRAAYDPFRQIADPWARAAFLAVRLFGLAVLVPVMEELFWRSFLIRAFTSADWRAASPGDFSWTAFGLVAAGFSLAHPEWLAAAVCACAYGLLLRRTRSLFACVVAHAVSNLALGAYVLTAHAWKYW